MGLGVFLVKEELSRPSVDGPSPCEKAETELQPVGPVSRRRHGDRSTWVFQSARCCGVQSLKGAADPISLRAEALGRLEN